MLFVSIAEVLKQPYNKYQSVFQALLWNTLLWYNLFFMLFHLYLYNEHRRQHYCIFREFLKVYRLDTKIVIN